jgi:hypothetical protein
MVTVEDIRGVSSAWRNTVIFTKVTVPLERGVLPARRDTVVERRGRRPERR